MEFNAPPHKYNAEGEERTIGIELEFAGIKPDRAAELITSIYNGEIQKKNHYEIDVKDTELGDFRVELDARILKKMASRNMFSDLDVKVESDFILQSLEGVLDKLARKVVPLEIVMPPIPISRLPRLEKLREVLQENRAEGTQTSLIHAFGMHINVEPPDLEIPTLVDHLRAFMILYPWLMDALDIDISRRISPFVDPFPDEYIKLLLDPEYEPDRDQFIKDYITYNPTRNRPVDMMPIFGLMREDLIESVMENEKNAPRPTFHYRLPNSRIDDPDWDFATEWNHWLVVEELADDEEMLDKLSRLYLLRRMETVMFLRKEWANTLRILLELED